MSNSERQNPASASSGGKEGNEHILLLQTRVLERIARGATLGETLETLAELIESESPGGVCGICVLDKSGQHIERVFGPNLPEEYLAGLTGMEIPASAPFPGPCAQCVAEASVVVTPHVRSDPRWEGSDWVRLLQRIGFNYCRSTPIYNSAERVVGSFALYLGEGTPEPPGYSHLGPAAAHLASIAIEREAAEHALKESDERLRTVLDGANLGDWDYRVTTGEIRWSDHCLELFCLPQGSSYEQFLAAVHPGDRERISNAVQSALDTSGHYSEEYRVLQPDGSYRWVAAMGRGVYDAEGRSVAMRGIAFDIGERKEAERRLQASEALARAQAESLEKTERTLRVALDATGMGLWNYLPDTATFSATERCREMMALPSENISLETWLEMVPEPDRARLRAALEACQSPDGDGSLREEYRLVLPDGRTRWMSAFGKAVYDDREGVRAVSRITGANVDITERKLMEQAVGENAERFRFLAESLPAKIFTADVEGEITYLNEQWATYTGRPLEVVESLGWREFVHPHDAEEKANTWVKAIREGTPFEFEHRFQRADGQYRWHLSRAQPLRDAKGRVLVWIGTNMDVHDLKQAQLALEESEGRVRLAMEAAGMGFWDWDIGRQVHWSPEHNRVVGLDPTVSEGSFQLFLERVHPEDRALLMEQLEHAELSGTDFSAEYRVILPDGAVRWVAGHGRPYFEPGRRRAVRMLGVVRDVTRRKNFEDLLRRQQEELKAALAGAEHARDEAESANRAKDHFLAVLSHELRTPLTPVLMAASTMLYDDKLDEETREALEMIRRNVQIESRLINDLLDLTRITRNKIELQISPLDLHQIVTQALEICRSEIEDKTLNLTVTLGAKPYEVEGDAARLQQVFWNLIKNAVKFTPSGGSIEVRTHNNNGHILVEIIDSGIGIAPDVLPRIFNPFEQGGESFSREFGGLGLGLAISKATIDAHEGTLEARSDGPGKGTTLLVRLRCRAAPTT